MKTLYVLSGLLLTSALAAQQPDDPKPTQPAGLEAQLEQLEQLEKKAVSDWRDLRKKVSEAKPDASGRMPAVPMRPDFSEYAEKALAIAEKHTGDAKVAELLVNVLMRSRDHAKPALEILLRDHLDSSALAEFGRNFEYLGQILDEDAAAKALARLCKSSDPAVRGWAQFARNSSVIKEADRDGDEYAAAKKALQKVADECGNKQLAATIRGAISEREDFGIGCTAPDIDGIDLDGVAFKLSDYKGKVLFVDFWGDW